MKSIEVTLETGTQGEEISKRTLSGETVLYVTMCVTLVLSGCCVNVTSSTELNCSADKLLTDHQDIQTMSRVGH